MIRYIVLLGFCSILSMSGREPAPSGVWRLGMGRRGGGRRRRAQLQGAGQYAMGAGVYNLETAEARSINAQTAMQWNDYVAQVSLESARNHPMRVHSEFQRNQALYDAHQRRLRENPGKVEIENGPRSTPSSMT